MSTYNRAHLAGKAIQSVLDQTFKDWEFIIIDDASQDNTREILEEYAKKDTRIKLVFNQKNVGSEPSKSPHMLASSSKYLAVLDDDDYWLPQNLEKKVAVMEANSWCEMCYSDIWRIGKDGKRRYWDSSKGKPFPNILPLSWLLRGDTFRELGGFDRRLKDYHAEPDYYIRVGGPSKFIHIGEPLGVMVMSPTSMSADRKKCAEGLKMLLEKHRDILSKDKKTLAEYYTRIGLHSVEAGESGVRYFLNGIKTYPLVIEAWGGLVLSLISRRLFLLLYKVYRRVMGYDTGVYE
jgi:glycosyltransferase involved in cell wall biosynthesis